MFRFSASSKYACNCNCQCKSKEIKKFVKLKKSVISSKFHLPAFFTKFIIKSDLHAENLLTLTSKTLAFEQAHVGVCGVAPSAKSSGEAVRRQSTFLAPLIQTPYSYPPDRFALPRSRESKVRLLAG